MDCAGAAAVSGGLTRWNGAQILMPVSSTFRSLDERRAANVAALAAAVVWLVLGCVLGLVAITSGGVALGALALFALLALACLGAAIAVLRLPGSSRAGPAAVLLGVLPGAGAVWSLVARSADDGAQSGDLAIEIAALSAAAFTRAAWRVGRSAS